MRFLAHLGIFAFLTLLTQIGGIAYAIALPVGKTRRSRIFGLAAFLFVYFAASFATTAIAPLFGRVPLSCFGSDQTNFTVQSPLYCVLNRNYVTEEMRIAVTALANAIDTKFPGTKTLALDANFPFMDGFPLLPHLSHSDGRKLDIAFFHQKNGHYLTSTTRSPIGYFAFETPKLDSPLPCAGRNDILTFRWNFEFLQTWFPVYQLENERLKETLRWLTNEGESFGVEKIFVEPHIASSLGISHERIRFQGCRAARHDDHIHFQIR